MIAIIDYGMGNLRSVQKAFERLGVETTITSDASVAASSAKVVLPGVGAIADAVAELKRANLIDAIIQTIESDKPFLGICLDSKRSSKRARKTGALPDLASSKARFCDFRESRLRRAAYGLERPFVPSRGPAL